MSFIRALWVVLLCVPILGMGWLFQKYSSSADAQEFEAGGSLMKVSHLGKLGINFKSIDGIKASGLSGLAWDADSESLFIVSDKGYLFRFKVLFSSDGLLSAVEPLYAVRLHGKDGKPLTHANDQDAEDLAIINGNDGKPDNTVLLISFEHNSRVAAYSVDGRWLNSITLPGKLERKQSYTMRNKSLESITIHPEYGILVAPELGMRKESGRRRVLYAIEPGQKNLRWQFYSLQHEESAVTSLEVAADGSLMVLERSWRGIFTPMTIAIRRIQLTDCEQFLPCQVDDLLIYEKPGWQGDNYEGIAHYKDNLFFLVSDNNGLFFRENVLTLVQLDLNAAE